MLPHSLPTLCAGGQGGVMVVGGNSKFDVPLNLYSLAMRSQSVLGVHRGTRDQLQQLVSLVAHGQVQSLRVLFYAASARDVCGIVWYGKCRFI